MPEAIDRLNAALDERYRIHSELGEGGMATVYLADDLKHERKVAVKVLRPELAALIGGERFLAEIKTTAALQHPHILPLFDSGEADGFLYYVMPYVDGESLRALLDRERQLDVADALRIAKAVASALQYAHDHDVIHRDIKPENILLHAGQPVVADFGIALAISAAGGGRLTETGLSLGTPHYMSPEQASADRELSARSDVYSLGCMLYEMLAGQPPHTGPTAQSILVRILTEDARPLTELRRTVPPNVAAAVTKAIEKLPADRFKSADELAAALDDEAFRWEPTRRSHRAVTPPPVLESPEADIRSWDTRSRVLAALCTFLGIVVGVQAFAGAGGPTTVVPDAPVVSFLLEDSADQVFTPAVGSDGSTAIVRNGVIHVRRAGSLREEPLQETSDANLVGFSPDAQWIAYSTSSSPPTLRKVPTAGGPVVTLASFESGGLFVPAWGEDGWIYVSLLGPEAGLYRVPDVGGAPESLFVPDAPGQPFEVAPIPGGAGVVVTVATGTGQDGHLVSVDLGTGDTATVVREGFSARWSPTGHLVYAHPSGSLFAVPFDPTQLEATGPAVPVLDGVGIFAAGVGRYDLSRSGTLIYVQAPAVAGGGDFAFTMLDPEGGTEVLPLEPTDHWDAGFSPDGRLLAYTRDDDIWVHDLVLGSDRRITGDGVDRHNPRWSPDGSEIAYRGRDSVAGIWVLPATGGEARLVAEGPDFNPSAWLPDGTILFTTDGGDIGAASEATEGFRMLLEAPWRESSPAISPDGRWMAYESDEGGSSALYARSWPDLETKIRISEGETRVEDFSYPLWSADGRTLYYHQGTSVVAAELDGADGGLRVTARTQVAVPTPAFYLSEIHPDGRLLVMTIGQVTEGTDGQAKLIVVTNWFTRLLERLGGAP